MLDSFFDQLQLNRVQGAGAVVAIPLQSIFLYQIETASILTPAKCLHLTMVTRNAAMTRGIVRELQLQFLADFVVLVFHQIVFSSYQDR